MLAIPAIDLRGGKCVRLRQGNYQDETVFSAAPGEVAEKFLEAGALRLHVVDLDGARTGRPENLEAIREIVRRCNRIGAPVQLGGGIRDEEALKAAFDLGVAWAIFGTRAARDPEWFLKVCDRYPEQLILGLDARDGQVAVEGWEAGTGIRAEALLRRCDGAPLAAVVYTDIAKDGMLAGPNVAATAALAKATTVPVIASGGVTEVEDVLALARADIPACIIGRSLYEGRIDYARLLQRLRRET